MRGKRTPCVVDVISSAALGDIDPGAVLIPTLLFVKSPPISGVDVLLLSIQSWFVAVPVEFAVYAPRITLPDMSDLCRAARFPITTALLEVVLFCAACDPTTTVPVGVTHDCSAVDPTATVVFPFWHENPARRPRNMH